jgi:hypothetical protein
MNRLEDISLQSIEGEGLVLGNGNHNDVDVSV